MAPRRGGGGSTFGGSSSGSGPENACADAGAFTDDYSIGILAMYAVFLALFIFAFIFYMLKRVRNKNMKRVLRWYTYAFALTLVILTICIFMLSFILQQCNIFNTYYDAYKLEAVGYWFDYISRVLLQAVVLLPLCSTLLDIAGVKFTIAKWVHVAQLVLVAILGIVDTGIKTYLNVNFDDLQTYYFYSGTYSDAFELRQSREKVATAYYFLLFVSTVSAAGVSIFALTKMHAAGRAPGALKLWVPFLMVFLAGFHLTDFAYIVRFLLPEVAPDDYTRETLLAITAVTYSFQLLAYVSLIFVASAQAIRSWDGTRADVPVYNAPANRYPKEQEAQYHGNVSVPPPYMGQAVQQPTTAELFGGQTHQSVRY